MDKPILTAKQIEARDRLLARNGKPLKEWDDTLNGCYFMSYPWSLIGIEKDGYAHT